MKKGFENIDEVVKQAFDGFEAEVDPSVWNNIQGSINAGGGADSSIQSSASSNLGGSAALKFVAGVAAVGVIAAAIYFSSDKTNNKVSNEQIVQELEYENNHLQEFVPENREQEDVNEVVDVEQNEGFAQQNIKEGKKTVEVLNEEIISQELKEEVVEEDVSISQPEKKNESLIVDEKEQSKKDNDLKEMSDNSQNKNNSEEASIKLENDKLENKKNIDLVIRTHNSFSPNGDQVEDTYKLSGDNIKSYYARVATVEGQLLFETNSIEEGWDGKDMQGNIMPVGVYIYYYSAKGFNGKTQNKTLKINLLSD